MFQIINRRLSMNQRINGIKNNNINNKIIIRKKHQKDHQKYYKNTIKKNQ